MGVGATQANTYAWRSMADRGAGVVLELVKTVHDAQNTATLCHYFLVLFGILLASGH